MYKLYVIWYSVSEECEKIDQLEFNKARYRDQLADWYVTFANDKDTLYTKLIDIWRVNP